MDGNSDGNEFRRIVKAVWVEGFGYGVAATVAVFGTIATLAAAARLVYLSGR